ncbi:hypothetical protein DICA4_D25642 [Diutina catenulata]
MWKPTSGAGSIWAQPSRVRRHSYDDAVADGGDIAQYFCVDPHRRVKVSLAALEQRSLEQEWAGAGQLPKFAPDAQLHHCPLVVVAFKAGRIDVFYVPPEFSRVVGQLAVGDLVTVEADRGRDLGRVAKVDVTIDEARMLKLLQFEEQQSALADGERGDSVVPPPALHTPKCVLSLAEPSEALGILAKRKDEDKACRLCLSKIASATASADVAQMKLIDAEYQFDRKKLIFYYSTSKRIDFRELVRELFRFYKTRIWMSAVTGVPYDAVGAGPSLVPVSPGASPRFLDGSPTFGSPPGASPVAPRFYAPLQSWGYDDFGYKGDAGHRPLPREEPSEYGWGFERTPDAYVLKSLVDSINH